MPPELAGWSVERHLFCVDQVSLGLFWRAGCWLHQYVLRTTLAGVKICGCYLLEYVNLSEFVPVCLSASHSLSHASEYQDLNIKTVKQTRPDLPPACSIHPWPARNTQRHVSPSTLPPPPPPQKQQQPPPLPPVALADPGQEISHVNNAS